MLVCSECSKELPVGSPRLQVAGQYYCEDCVRRCSRCVTYYVISEAHEDFPDYCQDCIRTCDDCGCETVNVSTCNNGGQICDDCYEANYFTCDSCGEIYHNDYYARDCYCRDCCEDEEGNNCLHAYDYQPHELNFYGGDEDSNELFFGVELEIEGPSDDCSDLEGDYFYLKHDGSLNNGFEVVSHPATWDWLNDRGKEEWNRVLELRKRGYRSYCTDTCGMHVHLSKDAFSSFHLYKWLQFFYGNPQFILDFSKRKPGRLAQWASLDGPHEKRDLILKAKQKEGYEKYEAVRITHRTIEVRIFRGTLKPEGFWKNLEFLTCLWDWTKDISSKDLKYLQPQYLWLYSQEHKEEFPNLVEWLNNYFREANKGEDDE